MPRTLAPLLATFLLALLAPLTAPAQVRDQANFFSPAATQRADQLIAQLHQQTGHTLLIDTLPSLPPDQQPQLQSLGKDRFFQAYTAQRAKQSGISGVYVLITRDPAHLQVAVGNQTARTGLFTPADRDRLRDSLLADFRAKHYDQGLLDAVSLTQRTMTANRAAAPSNANRTLQSFPGAAAPTDNPRAQATPQQTSSPHHSAFFWIVVIGGGFLLLFLLFRRLASRATGYGPAGYTRSSNTPPPLPNQPQQPSTYNSYPGYAAGTPATGGGFGRGILGGLLGGAAGSWLYDRMSHRNDYPGQSLPPTPTNPDAFPSAPPDTDFSSSSGADFGDSSDFTPPDDSGGGGDF